MKWFDPAGACGLLTFGLIFTAAPAQAPSKNEANCLTSGCHHDLTQRTFVHAPVAGNTCDACHQKQSEEAHTFRLVASMPQLCSECHGEYRGKTVHQPVDVGQCTACHDPHGSSAKDLLTATSNEVMCLQCHEEVTKDRRFLHGPVGAGDCMTCHQAHASEHSGLLTRDERALCLDCHTEIQERLNGSKNVHKPATDGCTSCHDPHGANHQPVLKAAQPDLCIECHEDVGTLATEAAHKHSPVTSGAACAHCHEPHTSAHDGLLRQASLDLCLKCHAEEIATAKGSIPNIAKQLRDAPNHHGPIQQKDCVACHSVHGGEHSRLLAKAYAEKFYQPYSDGAYALCFECHDAAAFTEPETDSTTGFRNGERNLHYVHVNRNVKGRSCRACHDVHATTGPKLIVESAAFGKWRIPLNFKATATGGSCMSGCHQAYRYDRETPVALRPKPE